jgi:hypothetical protein
MVQKAILVVEAEQQRANDFSVALLLRGITKSADNAISRPAA